MSVGVYNLKRNRAIYSLLFLAFVEGIKNAGGTCEAVQSSSKGFTPRNSTQLSVTFTNALSNIGNVLKKQIEEQNRYLTIYIGAFHKKGIVGTQNRNSIYGWDTNSRPREDALYYCDLLSTDYMQHEFIGESFDRIEELNYFNLDIKPWKTGGDYILIPEQIHPEGMGHGISNWIDWAKNKCLEIRNITDMPIKIRRHPNRFAWKDFQKDISKNFQDVEFTDGTSLDEDLKNAYALVTLSSRCVVEAVINGVHCFTQDLNSIAYPVCNTKLDFLKTPKKFDRKSWLAKVAYSHWSIEEIISGDYYRHLSKAIL